MEGRSMLFAYETERLLLKIIKPDQADAVLDFYMRDKELFEKMVYYSGEELMLLRDSKYIIRRDTDKFREFLRKWRVRCSCLTRQWKDFWQ